MADPIYANPLIDPQIDVNNLNTIYSSEYITQNYNTFFNQNTESERLDYMPVGYENQESFDPLETSYGLDFKSNLEAQGFVNYIQNNPIRRTATTSGPTVTAEGTILTPQQIKQRLAGPPEQRVVRQGEILPFYTGQEETGKSVFDFWKDIPNISSFSEGLRGTMYGISRPVSDQPEPAASPAQQQQQRQQQRQTGRPLFGPGGHPGTPELSLYGMTMQDMQKSIADMKGANVADGIADPDTGQSITRSRADFMSSRGASSDSDGSAIGYSGPEGDASGAYGGSSSSGTGSTGVAGPASPSSVSPWCWVARKVYGEDNPKWKLFRAWLFTQAPKWLYKAYGKYGERFAEWLDGKPILQKIIRKWMDKRIEKYLNTQPKTAQEIGPC